MTLAPVWQDIPEQFSPENYVNYRDYAEVVPYSAEEVEERCLAVARNPGEYIFHRSVAMANALRKESWETNRLENRANEFLSGPERFLEAHKTARHVIDIDIRRTRQRIYAGLLILDSASDRLRRDFVVGTDETRDRLIRWVIAKGGIYQPRQNRRPVWVEMPPV